MKADQGRYGSTKGFTRAQLEPQARPFWARNGHAAVRPQGRRDSAPVPSRQMTEAAPSRHNVSASRTTIGLPLCPLKTFQSSAKQTFKPSVEVPYLVRSIALQAGRTPAGSFVQYAAQNVWRAKSEI